MDKRNQNRFIKIAL